MRTTPAATIRTTRLPPLGPALVILAAGLAACGGASTTPTSSLGDVATASPPAVATATAGSSISATVPHGFPVMPGSKAVEPVPPEAGLIARWANAENGAAVYDFFVDALPAAGMQVDRLVPGGAAAEILFTPPAGPQLALALTAADDGTRIDLRLPDPAD